MDFNAFTDNWPEQPRERARAVFAACQAAAVDEETSLLAGMLAGGRTQDAEIRSRIIDGAKAKLDHAANLVETLGFSQGNELDAEIFAAGTWNKSWKFSARDLHDIAANFASLADNHKVPLKFGHNDEQPMTDGYPALGWVTKVWVKGDKLMAHFTNVPAIVKKAFDAKLYRHVSVELDVDVEHRGKKYKYVLSAVALLGADIPAVNTLNDLTHYLDGGERLAASRREVFSAIQGDRSKLNEDNDMTKEELEQAIKAAVAPIEASVAKFSTENATLKAENETLKAAQAKQTEQEAAGKIKMHRETLTGKLEAAVKDKRLTPAQREAGIKFMRLGDDKAVMEVTDSMIDEYITVNGGKAKMSNEQGKGGGTQNADNTGTEFNSPGDEIVARALKLQGEDGKLSFAAARDRVMKADPALGKAWLGTDEDAA
jgi:hypothetical protein